MRECSLRCIVPVDVGPHKCKACDISTQIFISDRSVEYPTPVYNVCVLM